MATLPTNDAIDVATLSWAGAGPIGEEVLTLSSTGLKCSTSIDSVVPPLGQWFSAEIDVSAAGKKCLVNGKALKEPTLSGVGFGNVMAIIGWPAAATEANTVYFDEVVLSQ